MTSRWERARPVLASRRVWWSVHVAVVALVLAVGHTEPGSLWRMLAGANLGAVLCWYTMQAWMGTDRFAAWIGEATETTDDTEREHR